jgi:hypothetical protein
MHTAFLRSQIAGIASSIIATLMKLKKVEVGGWNLRLQATQPKARANGRTTS